MTKPLAVIHTGHAAPEFASRYGDFEQIFLRLGGIAPTAADIVFAARGEQPRPPDAYSGAIVAGSPSMVTDRLPWSESLAVWLRGAVAAGLPLLAVCFGHQLLAHALGGEVDYHPRGMELGTKAVRLHPAASAHPWLAELPPVFPANLCHSQTVVRTPPGGVVLAASEHDAHQIIAYGERAMGLQFHPEFDGAMLRAIIEQEVRDGGISGETGLRFAEEATDTPEALGLLHAFVGQTR